ncbi:hypothetical protein ACFE04_002205 [Oxalis oulophora]
MTALHLAARHGHINVMRWLVLCCPCSAELVDARNCNAVHFVMESKKRDAIIFVLKTPSLRKLVNEYNGDGNAPTHQLAISSGPPVLNFIKHPEVDAHKFNKHNNNTLDLLLQFGNYHLVPATKIKSRWVWCGLKRGRRIANISNGDEIQEGNDLSKVEMKRKKGSKEDTWNFVKEGRDGQLIAAALIATVAFTSRQKYIFGDERLIIQSFIREVTETRFAVISMLIAFVSGTYAILAPSRKFNTGLFALAIVAYMHHYYRSAWIIQAANKTPWDYLEGRIKKHYCTDSYEILLLSSMAVLTHLRSIFLEKHHERLIFQSFIKQVSETHFAVISMLIAFVSVTGLDGSVIDDVKLKVLRRGPKNGRDAVTHFAAGVLLLSFLIGIYYSMQMKCEQRNGEQQRFNHITSVRIVFHVLKNRLPILSLIDDYKPIATVSHNNNKSSRSKLRLVDKKRLRRGSRYVSGRSSYRSGTRRCCSVDIDIRSFKIWISISYGIRNVPISTHQKLNRASLEPERIRNFSIIAHGKSTLADRLLELTGTIKKGIGQPQYLHKLQRLDPRWFSGQFGIAFGHLKG